MEEESSKILERDLYQELQDANIFQGKESGRTLYSSESAFCCHLDFLRLSIIESGKFARFPFPLSISARGGGGGGGRFGERRQLVIAVKRIILGKGQLAKAKKPKGET